MMSSLTDFKQAEAQTQSNTPDVLDCNAVGREEPLDMQCGSRPLCIICWCRGSALIGFRSSAEISSPAGLQKNKAEACEWNHEYGGGS
jgi:hypothetical protein